VTSLSPDLEAVVQRVGHLWEVLRGARVLITGGTGFVGRWLLGSLVVANRELSLGVRVVVLARRPEVLARVAPELAAEPSLTLLKGDVRALRPDFGPITHVIHGATAASASFNLADPAGMLDVIENGARSLLGLCEALAVQRLLLLSSGAVYRQPCATGVPLTEDAPLGPDAPEETSAYHAGKRLAERLAWEAVAEYGLRLTVARPFALVGPYLPLDSHFAIGNFIRDALEGGPVVVKGDGTAVRSYLYAGDMAAWLWAMLLDEGAVGRTYNVGGERALSIAEVARVVSDIGLGDAEVEIRGGVGSSGGGEWYVPCTARAQRDLGVMEWTRLEEAVRHTIAWNRRGGA